VKLLTAPDVYLSEADGLLNSGDVVQASEKYYKAAEEAVKLIAIKMNMKDIIEQVRIKGRWSSQLLFDAASRVSRNFYNIWTSAWYLHIYGFHEMKLSIDELKILSDNVKRVISFVNQS
jgi:hypothetical protein